MSSSNCPPLLPTVTKLQVDSVTFPPSVISPASSNPLFLGGAGVRGLEIQGKFMIFTVIGVYLDPVVVPSLSVKWKGKTTEELTESVPFFREIVTEIHKVAMKLPLTGQQYSEKVTENCVAIWKSLGIYTDSEAKDVERFVQVFKDEMFPPGASILFALSSKGSLTLIGAIDLHLRLHVAYSKDDSIPETGKVVIENKLLAEAVLESIIGKNSRLAQLMKNNKVEEDATKTDQEEANDLPPGDKLAKEN
ncbi:hypothetical protein Bca52824_022783 [Brassica carinata]|uniref:Chalcone-flavonone isomerase family protein n=1 Tax=Brassica carinata TaxID=52824 RepID=A0A8X7VHB9_BRACI|nr:hypothetical protein Bca52824_022783 [Brassica carinata]